MSIKRITIRVPFALAARIKRAAGSMSVSSWLTQLVIGHLDDSELERQWQEFYDSVHPRLPDRRRARAIYSRVVKPRRRRGRAIG
jgi:hypothetical protein